jgi:hypothetical protein
MRLIALACALMGCVDSSKLGGTFDCMPGQMEIVGCSANIGRDCSGRPRMSLCDGDAIAHEDCSPNTPMPPLLYATPAGGCPNVTITCPASGSIAVGISQGGSGPFACTWDHAPLSP